MSQIAWTVGVRESRVLRRCCEIEGTAFGGSTAGEDHEGGRALATGLSQGHMFKYAAFSSFRKASPRICGGTFRKGGRELEGSVAGNSSGF